MSDLLFSSMYQSLWVHFNRHTVIMLFSASCIVIISICFGLVLIMLFCLLLLFPGEFEADCEFDSVSCKPDRVLLL